VNLEHEQIAQVLQKDLLLGLKTAGHETDCCPPVNVEIKKQKRDQ
jgi:hypothetical protein